MNNAKLSISYLLQITTAYFLIQSWLFYEACSSPVKISHFSESQTIEDRALADLMDDSEIEDLSFNTSPTTFPPQKPGNADVKGWVLTRLKRHPRPCVLKVKQSWNECLGRRFTEIHCRKRSVACLSANNVPPKCKEIVEAIPGPNGYCPVVTRCTCAA